VLVESLLVISVLVLFLTLVAMGRRGQAFASPYFFLIGGVLTLAILAFSEQDLRFSVVAIGLTMVMVGGPALIDALASTRLVRSKPNWLVRLAVVRGYLMPGASMNEQIEIVRVLELVDRKGPAAAMVEVRELLRRLEDPQALALAHEQMVVLLVLQRQWDEACVYVDRWFALEHLATRPPLACLVARILGEKKRLRELVAQVHSLEAVAMREPRVIPWVDQIALIALAYGGMRHQVERVVGQVPARRLALTPAAALFLQAVAQHRSGDRESAIASLRACMALAAANEKRLHESAEAELAELESGRIASYRIEMDLELKTHFEQIATRMTQCLRDIPELVDRALAPASVLAIVGAAILFAITAMTPDPVLGVLSLGYLTPEHWLLGHWLLAFSTPWLHGSVLGLLLDVYLIGIVGRLLERRLGLAPVVALLTWVPGLGLLLGATMVPSSAGAGGMQMMAVVLGAALLAHLLTLRLPNDEARRSRRPLVILISLLWASHAMTMVALSLSPSAGPLTLLVTTIGALGWTWLTRRHTSRRYALAWKISAGAGLSLVLAAFGFVLVSPSYRALSQGPTVTCTEQGAVLQLPVSFRRMVAVPGFIAPFQAVVVDTVAFQVSSPSRAVMMGILATAADSKRLAYLDALVDGGDVYSATQISGEMHEPFAALMGAAPGEWQARDLRIDGKIVARVIERKLGADAKGVEKTIVLRAEPNDAIAARPSLYAQILAQARLLREGEEVPTCEALLQTR
jgi:hypothetical protein